MKNQIGNRALWVGTVGLAIAVANAGCRRGGTEQPAAEKAFQSAMEEAHQRLMSGQTNEALRLMEEGLQRADFQPWRGDILNQALGILIASDRMEDAQRLFLDQAAGGEAVIGPSLGVISARLEERGDLEGLAAWHEKLVALDLSPRLSATAWLWLLDAYRQLGDEARVLARLSDALKKVPVPEGKGMLDGLLGRCVEASSYDLAERILKQAESDPAYGPAVEGMAALWRLQARLAQEQWEAAEAFFREQAPRLSDADVAEMLMRIGRSVTAKDLGDRFDALFHYAATDLKKGPNSAERGARFWLSSAEKQGDSRRVADRLSDIALVKEMAPAAKQRLFNQYFYTAMKAGKSDPTKRLLESARSVREQLAAVHDVKLAADMDALLLDGAVLAEEYAEALNLVRRGVGPSDPAWRAMAENKIAAHLALQEGRREEAIERFRTFMDHIRKQGGTTLDPTTGLQFTPDMTLGFNAKRIGDLYSELGRHDQARAAYDEARTFYQAALSAVGEETDEGRYIRERLSELDKTHAAP